jgi:hypothetical protein
MSSPSDRRLRPQQPKSNRKSASFRNRLKKEIKTLRTEHMKAVERSNDELANELDAMVKQKEGEWIRLTVGLDDPALAPATPKGASNE